MRIRLLVAASLLGALSPAPAALTESPALKGGAQAPQGADEALIRALIRKLDEGDRVGRSPDFIFASGITPRPLVGQREIESFARRAGKTVEQGRPNSKTQTTVRRLLVAEAGDLAYEFSHFVTEWDGPEGTRAGFHGSHLRVWRKVKGEWLMEAVFMRPDRR